MGREDHNSREPTGYTRQTEMTRYLKQGEWEGGTKNTGTVTLARHAARDLHTSVVGHAVRGAGMGIWGAHTWRGTPHATLRKLYGFRQYEDTVWFSQHTEGGS